MARPYGIVPRDSVEEVAWPALRGQVFAEASEIFLRLLKGEVVSSDMIRPTILTRDNFRSDEDWEKVQQAAVTERRLDSSPESIEINRRYDFEEIKTIPQDWRRELLNLVLEVMTLHYRSKSTNNFLYRCSTSVLLLLILSIRLTTGWRRITILTVEIGIEA